MRISETAPPACSGCGRQDPDQRHVDFEAAYDGPVVEGGVVGFDGQVTSSLPVPIDDLILCEHCVTTAGALIGLVPEDRDRIGELEEELARARSTSLELKRHVDQQDKALKSRDSFGNAVVARKPQAKKPVAA